MKKNTILLLFASCMILAGCAGTTSEKEATTSENSTTASESATESTISTEMDGSAEETDASTETSATESEKAGYTLADLAKYTYEFSSGAGGWSTDFTIEEDGSFRGNYHDSELGDTGEGYENGTVICADFEGHFSELSKVSDYVYEMKLLDITYGKEGGTEEIADGVRYSYVDDAYGLTGTERFLVYIPGAAVSDLDEEVYTWVMWSVEGSDTLTMPIIVNEDQKEGIYSYERLSAAEEAESIYANYLSSYEACEEALSNATTQTEMDEESSEMYNVADNCINEIWNIVKYNVSDYDTVLEEQRSWISEKEAKAKEAMSAYDGGTLANTAFNQVAAEMTMDRCKELLELLQ